MKHKFLTLLLAIGASVGMMNADIIKIGDLYYQDSVRRSFIPPSRFVYDTLWVCVIESPENDKYSGDIVIPSTIEWDGNTLSVDYIDNGAFLGCSGLTSVTIPNSITSIGNFAFTYCTGLTSIDIPNSVAYIGSSSFHGCTGLTSVTIPNSVTNIGVSAFRVCTGLTSINVAEDNPNYCSVEGILFNKNITTLIQYPSGKQGAYNIPNSVTSIGNNAFEACSGLSSVTIPNSITSIGSATFFLCSGLTSIEIPNSITSIGENAFGGCSGLNSVTIPNSVTSIGESAFHGCTGLTSIEIPNSVISIGSFAFENTGLTSVTIPNSVTSIRMGVFRSCTGLTSVYVAEDNANYCSMDGILFDKNRTKLILYPGGKQGEYYCIPNSVTSIDDYAFLDGSSLDSIEIPNSVTSIGRMVFYSCNNLTSLICKAVIPPVLQSYPFSWTNYPPIYVPAESVAAYKSADIWNGLDIRAIVHDDPTPIEQVALNGDEPVKIVHNGQIYILRDDKIYTLTGQEVR